MTSSSSQPFPPTSSETQTPFDALPPLLREINRIIYAFWKIPCPPSSEIIPVLAPPDHPLEVNSPPPNIAPQPPAPQSGPTPLAASEEATMAIDPPPSPTNIATRQTLQRIARLHKMHWSKPKATHCAGRRKLKRGQG
ncbi:MAG: hypothetical protein VKJ27_03975 [Synechocystis sp.]|nr:hypothetical protein [Synechocystis sp.]